MESLYDETMHKYSGTTNSNAVKEIRTRNKVHIIILKSSDKDVHVLHDFIIKIEYHMAVSQPFLFVQMSSCLCKSSFCSGRMVPINFNLPSLRHCLCKNLK